MVFCSWVLLQTLFSYWLRLALECCWSMIGFKGSVYRNHGKAYGKEKDDVELNPEP